MLTLNTTQSFTSVLKKLIAPPLVRKISKYTPHVESFYENKKFIVKTVTNGNELAKALNLRYAVFYKEMLNRKKFFEYDIDKFDLMCDHVVIIDKASGDFIGTYRLNSSLYNNRFYTASEFKMGSLQLLEGNKLELGRACVHEQYRNGMVLMQLWKGIRDYVEKTHTRYLFGCTSIKTMDPYQMALINRYLENRNMIIKDSDVSVRRKFKLKAHKDWVHDLYRQDHPVTDEIVESILPPLFLFYLKIGAKVCPEPALDKAFRCCDYLTVLDMTGIESGMDKKIKR